MTSSTVRGAVRWAAPEVFEEYPTGCAALHISGKSDVYSFGGIMYQVGAKKSRRSSFLLNFPQALSGDIPFANILNDIRVGVAVTAGKRPERSRAISEVNWAFIQRCWDGDPEKRPRVSEIRPFLETTFEKPRRGGSRGIWTVQTAPGQG
jgi:serine/threonine protein kinase